MKRRHAAVQLLVLLLLAQAANPIPARAADPAPGPIVTEHGRVLPPMPAGMLRKSVQAEMLATEGATPRTFTAGGVPTVPLSRPTASAVAGGYNIGYSAAALPNGLRKEILGFLPYWMLTDSALSSMNYNLLSTVAYFSVGTDVNGHLIKGSSSTPSTGWAGWTSDRMTGVINLAHANGVRVVLTVTMMAWDSTGAANMAAFLGSSSARAQLVSEIVAAVGSRNADGVSLDFEPVGSSLRSQYTAFVRQLKQGLTDAGVGSYLTVCVTAGAATWATGYDVAALIAAGAADHLFVMGYDYSWSGSARAGGVAPILSPYTVDVSGTMNDFLAEAPGSKIIWGVPYYGRTWPTSSNQLNATTLGGGSKAYYYTGSLSQSNQYGRRWDDVGEVPWYAYYDSAAGNWVEGYYDDVASLGVKYDLVNARGFAGTGMWTLLMDQGHSELWRLLADKFVTDTSPPVGGISLLPATQDAEALHVSWRGVDYASGIDHYNVAVRRLGTSTWTTWLSGTQRTDDWYPATPGATYEFRVQAVDYLGNEQPWVTVPDAPPSLSPQAFAQVVTDRLNIRTGAGVGYGVVTTLDAGAYVYVLDGPVAADGYSWYRVEYGFTEWPAAGYPTIGWASGASSTDPYLAPAPPPTRTRSSPFVSGLAVTAELVLYGDSGVDRAVADYQLIGPAADVRLEVLDTAGTVVRTIDLGAQGPGSQSAAWDGRSTGGSPAPEGRYLLRIVATEGGGATHAAPAADFGPSLLDTWGTVLRYSPFDDIADSVFKRDIEWIYAHRITYGCSSSAYCPQDPVLREQMASFLVRAFALPPTSTDFFTDDDASSHQADINALAASSVTKGCGLGLFCPKMPVTRAQMASFLVRVLRLPRATTDFFNDDDSSPFQADINSLAAAGITAGCGPRQFCPDATVTRGQMAAFLRRAITR